ncbi:DNA adenine methylase [Desulforamulus aquiferis]|uniref:Site-specific DNA-methyltransferase (adenine-specific) n=1 Tax=Desulforamulus aquiferis TaxID=1397668 RepID=A0AAW7ZDN0_9FIRM|nr:DNA adenine methylase [Desulforamulus aquiferis]MDO7787344.1 DNA adenine methylase [Desulforamulus aquiferis]
MKKNKLVSPILKWAGGKRQLIEEIKKYVPDKFTTYYEPFIGGAAVLFHIQPHKAVINDINSELMNVYQVIKYDVESLIKDLAKHKNQPEYFYQIRELDRDKEKYSRLTQVEKASRIIYLNKTCYNGLFRVNRAGEFNAPFGKYRNPNIVNEITLRAVNNYFNKAKITFLNGDFEDVVKGIRKGSFVYFDPPYDPVSSSANFTGYDKGGFNRAEQERLKKLCDTLNNKGVKFLLSNSATDFIKHLYRDYRVEIIQAKRAINSKGELRGEVDEVLVRNFE